MKNLKSLEFFNLNRDRVICIIALLIFTIPRWIINWTLEKKFDHLTTKLTKMEFIEIAKPISSFMVWIGIVSLIVLLIYWTIKDRKKDKEKYFDSIEYKIKINEIKLDFQRFKDRLGREPDYLDLARNFSDESLKLNGYDDEQIRKINKYRNK